MRSKENTFKVLGEFKKLFSQGKGEGIRDGIQRGTPKTVSQLRGHIETNYSRSFLKHI